MARKISKRLFDACPEAREYWDEKRNASIDPNILGSGSEQLVWWKCKEGHEFNLKPKDFKKRSTGKCLKCKSIGFLYPELCKEIDTDKHPDLETLLSTTAGSTKKVWWICPKGHKYEAQIYSRATKGTGCDICSKSSTSKQEIRLLCELRTIFKNIEWRSRLFRQEIDIYLPKYKIGVEFDGAYWHRGKEEKDAHKNELLLKQGITILRVREEPLEKISQYDVLTSGERKTISKEDLNNLLRSIKSYTDEITSKKIDDYISKSNFQGEDDYTKLLAEMPVPYEKSITKLFPDLVKEWHPTKNHPLTPKILTPSSTTKVWWQCENGHAWKKSPDQRTQTKKIVGNCRECISVGFLRPDLLDRISSKNKEKDIASKSIQSPEVVWWECENGHHFQRPIREAAGYKQRKIEKELYCVTCQSFSFKYPELLTEFNRKRNSKIDPMTISFSSKREVWWKCKNGHEWQQPIVNRTKNYPNPQGECLTCRSIGFNRKDLMEEWHPTKNSDLDPMSIATSSDQMIWWQCKNGHEWSTTAYARCRNDYPDPLGKTKGFCKECP